MDSQTLRRRFLDFFRERGHEVVPSASLVPAGDPTLLFTNAGMVPFKDVFLGRARRDVPRAVSAQRCVRAGGKHNDLENVGYTARHHTFFEMLGNFSFGDYFKREAIRYAWEFVTGELGIAPAKLWITVHQDDDEAAAIWLEEIGVDPARFSRLTDDNFWAMGDTGPCGPSSEIFYDHGPEVAGGPPGSPDAEGDRYIEIWNLVFMQYERDEQGTLRPLPKPSVDTGMGLERAAAVLQGVHSNYEIDLFVKLIRAAAEAVGTQQTDANSLRVIADHIRACSFLIADGVLPSNEGRGYVLRRIIRRAIRHGYKLGCERPFFHRLVGALAAEMGEAYPELVERRAVIEQVLRQEEERFAETLKQGMSLLEEAIAAAGGGVIPGETAFRLYDTYGFPVDLTADIARERGLAVDQQGFEEAMQAQRRRARAASRFAGGKELRPHVDADTQFTGYEALDDTGRVVALFCGAEPVSRLASGDEGIVVLDRTPFYAEGGGQVGDTGELLAGDAVRFAVGDTQKLGSAHGHYGRLEAGEIALGQTLQARVDAERRIAIMSNHSATHLLHAALRRVLGSHVQQKGSLVAPDRLRFDFSHHEPVAFEQLMEIENLVNAQIRRDMAATSDVMAYNEALEAGALAFFGDQYGERVRVLRFGDFSVELCGGTHVSRVSEIGLFKIISESGVAAGVRRIEAVTGAGALEWIARGERTLARVAGLVRGGREDAEEKVRALIQRVRTLEKDVEKLRSQLAAGGGRDLGDEVVEVSGVKLLVSRIEGADASALRAAVDRFKNKLGSGVVVLATVDEGKVRLAAGVTRDLTDRVQAGALLQRVAEQVGGRGGGRADFAQAGGSRPEALDGALARVAGDLEARLAG